MCFYVPRTESQALSSSMNDVTNGHSEKVFYTWHRATNNSNLLIWDIFVILLPFCTLLYMMNAESEFARLILVCTYVVFKVCRIFKLALFSVCICVRFMQNGLSDPRSQTLPTNSSLSEQNEIGDSSSEIQSQRSPDGSEDGDSSQSKSKHTKSSFTQCYFWVFMTWLIVCLNEPWRALASVILFCGISHSLLIPMRKGSVHIWSRPLSVDRATSTLLITANCRGFWQSRWIMG